MDLHLDKQFVKRPNISFLLELDCFNMKCPALIGSIRLYIPISMSFTTESMQDA